MTWLWVVLAFLAGAAGMWVYLKRSKPVEPEVPVEALMLSVKQLHKVLFAGFGTVVTPMFNSMWRAAGLSEKGVPDIKSGKT